MGVHRESLREGPCLPWRGGTDHGSECELRHVLSLFFLVLGMSTMPDRPLPQLNFDALLCLSQVHIRESRCRRLSSSLLSLTEGRLTSSGSQPCQLQDTWKLARSSVCRSISLSDWHCVLAFLLSCSPHHTIISRE